MPEMHFRIRWPDGSAEACYSPSLVIRDFFNCGESYSLADFVERSRKALNLASERVKAKYGWPCARATAQLTRIETNAAAFAALNGARVTIDAFEDEQLS